MMASYILFAVCVVLCTVHAVHSYTLTGRIYRSNGYNTVVNVSNNISGANWSSRDDNWFNIRSLQLDRLVDAQTLPSLMLTNFKYVDKLYLYDIALENVPIFVNTSRVNILVITGNKIKSVPAYAFSGPRPWQLTLSNNEIHSMADRSVNMGANYVSLGCNKLSNFSQSWFEAPASITVLDLSSNRIEYIQDRAFNQMPKLEWLYLSRNRVTSIGSEVFSTGITGLYLQFNNIAQLTTDMFAHRDTPMKYLYLHHNQLSFLPEALLLKVKPSEILLVGNPWQCQCLRDIERWLRELNSTRFDTPARPGEPVCVVPVNFQNLCIPVVDTELQQTYARALSPVDECSATRCKSCNGTADS